MDFNIKDNLYLAALLQHIDENRIKDFYNFILSNFGEKRTLIEFVLAKADLYATANEGTNGNLEFVASPFENLKFGKGDYKYSYVFEELTLGKDMFPVKDISKKLDKKSRWNRFSNDFFQIKNVNYKELGAATLALLNKYAISIPNPSSKNPEISWFDYAKIKSGIAIALYDYLIETEESNISDSDCPIVIVRADVSGIQNFISSIASKQASKNLKGRSFYVQLLSDTVLMLMLEELGLYEGNVMYASGGNFFVIAPNVKKVQAAFNYENESSFESRITKAIFNEHKMSISVVMGYEKISQFTILNGNINEAIISLFERKIDVKKKQKFSNLIVSNYDLFFNENKVDKGGKVVTDCITGEELDEKIDYIKGKVYVMDEEESYPKLESINTDGKTQQFLKVSTAKQIFIGGHLKEAHSLGISHSSLNLNDDLQQRFEIALLPTFDKKVYCYLITNNNRADILKQNTTMSIIAINSFNISTEARSFILYGGNDYPTKKDGTPKAFHNLVGEEKEEDKEEDGKFKRLGVLRMDIDGLGGIFKNYIPFPQYKNEAEKGKKREGLSFALYATISRNLDWFFKGYLNTMWNNNNDYKSFTQIIYSGGDDLFIVGRWDLIIDFAEEIKKELARFTCAEVQEEKNQITISGGISIVTSKFPIMKASSYANKAEDSAKKHNLRNQGVTLFEKNSIDFLGMPLHWNSEYNIVKALKDDLLEMIDDGNPDENFLKKGGVPKSIISKIQIHYVMMNAYKKLPNKLNPKWIWVSAYDFSQLEHRLREKSKQYIRKLEQATDEGNKNYLKHILTKIQREGKIVENIKQGLFTNRYEAENGKSYVIDSKYHFLELLNLAARWAQLTNRSK